MIRRTIAAVGIVLALFVLQACSTAPGANRQVQTSSSPDEVTRQFYDWYLHARFPNPDKANKAKFQKYVTQKFLKEAADEWDAVLFIAAQDADPTWANDFSVAKAKIKGDEASTQVALKGKKVHYTLKVFLKREAGAWKIDNVKRGSWKAIGN